MRLTGCPWLHGGLGERGNRQSGCQTDVREETTALRENDTSKTKSNCHRENKLRSLRFVAGGFVVVGKHEELELVWKP